LGNWLFFTVQDLFTGVCHKATLFQDGAGIVLNAAAQGTW
jgi:hypothetical protein